MLGNILTLIIRLVFILSPFVISIYLTKWGAKKFLSKSNNSGFLKILLTIGIFVMSFLLASLIVTILLAAIWTLEQVVFSGSICFGLSCPISFLN